MKRHIPSLALAICATFFSISAKADVSEATFTPQGSAYYQPVAVSDVEVYVYKPEFKFKVIGVIEARGMAGGVGSLLDQLDITKIFDASPGEKEDIALAMRALKEEAANAGATGVLILQSRQIRVSADASERRIKAAAIRHLD